MSFAKILTVFRKEMVDSLRDRRTVLMMILVPILIYPVLFIFIGQLQNIGLAKLEVERSPVSVKGRIPPQLDSLLAAEPKLAVVASDDPGRDLAAKRIRAFLEPRAGAGPESLVVFYDGAVERSRVARSRLESVLERYRTACQVLALRRHGLDTVLLRPFEIGSTNLAPPSRMGSFLLGFLLPIMLVVTLMMGAMYPAIDLTAGEKERGTMETILTVPIDRRELFLGKYLTVCSIAVITGLLNLASMMATFSAGFIQLGAAMGKMEFTLTPQAIALILLLLLPLAMFISAVLLSAALFARSFKDAQNYITPIQLLLILPTQIAAAPGIQLTPLLAMVPIANVTLLFKEVILNNFPGELIFLTFLSNIIYALLGITVVGKLFGSEDVLLAEGRGTQLTLDRKGIRPSRALSPSTALVAYAVIMLLLFYVAGFLQIRYRHWGVVATEWGLIFLPVLSVCWYARADLRSALNLRSFRPLSLLGTLILCLGFIGITVWAGLLQARLFPESVKVAETLRKYLDLKDAGLGLGTALLIVAVGPGVCEELLFRGLLLSSFRGRMRPALAVLLIALLFGITHMNLFRLVPTFLLGLYLTFIVYRTGSVFLSMLAHTANNGLAVLILYRPDLVQRLPWVEGSAPFPLLALAGFLALAVAGAALVVFDTRQGSPADR